MISSSDRGHETDNVWGRKHKSSCRPPEGKTYLTIGQDFFSIQEYLLSQYNASLHRPGDHHIHTEVGNSFGSAPNILPFNYFNPACTMTYTDIYQLKGLDQPADYGSGIEYAKGERKQWFGLICLYICLYITPFCFTNSFLKITLCKLTYLLKTSSITYDLYSYKYDIS